MVKQTPASHRSNHSSSKRRWSSWTSHTTSIWQALSPTCSLWGCATHACPSWTSTGGMDPLRSYKGSCRVQWQRRIKTKGIVLFNASYFRGMSCAKALYRFWTGRSDGFEDLVDCLGLIEVLLSRLFLHQLLFYFIQICLESIKDCLCKARTRWLLRNH